MILEFMDRTISDSETIQNEFNMVVLGSIPYMDDNEKKIEKRSKGVINEKDKKRKKCHSQKKFNYNHG
ncbi:hypothetical protein ACQZUM_001910 [Enterococcus hirae]